jgi:hypothetical protein
MVKKYIIKIYKGQYVSCYSGTYIRIARQLLPTKDRQQIVKFEDKMGREFHEIHLPGAAAQLFSRLGIYRVSGPKRSGRARL